MNAHKVVCVAKTLKGCKKSNVVMVDKLSMKHSRERRRGFKNGMLGVAVKSMSGDDNAPVVTGCLQIKVRGLKLS